MDTIQIIQTLGFPIACVVFCGLFIYKIVMRDKDEAATRESSLVDVNAKNAEALSKIADTISETNALNKELSEKNKLLASIIDEKLDRIELNVEHIKDSIAFHKETSE